MSKELWIAAYERLVEEYMEEGLTEAQAEALAEENASEYLRNDLFYMAKYRNAEKT